MAVDEPKLSLEQRELVAVGASVGSGCQRCVSYHLEAGTKAGLTDQRLLGAATSSEQVAAEAAGRMAAHVRGQLGVEAAASPATSPLDEALASFGAALGANDLAGIERHMLAAAGLGASRAQLAEAIEVAHKVQENAARIHLREAERLLERSAPVAIPPDEGEPEDGCGCGEDSEARGGKERIAAGTVREA